MHLSPIDMMKQKLMDAQENVRDFQEYSGRVEDKEIDEVFKRMAEDNAMHARKLQELLAKHDRHDTR